jgi:hypothetical protein
MSRIKRIALGVFALLALSCAPAQASQTPATKRLEEDRKQIRAEDRKEAAVHNKLVGGLTHSTERIAKDEVKVKADQAGAEKVQSEVEAEEALGAPRPVHLEHLQALEKKRNAKVAEGEQRLATDELESEQAQLAGEAELSALEAQREATEAQIVADEAAIAEGG